MTTAAVKAGVFYYHPQIAAFLPAFHITIKRNEPKQLILEKGKQSAGVNHSKTFNTQFKNST